MVPVLYAMHTPTPSDFGTDPTPSARAPSSDAPAAGYGLRREVLSPMETLAQSVSTMAPTTTPAATIPLVCALAGNATWLAYVLATAAVLLVAWCIGRYARYSASPGSLYTYAAMTLPPGLRPPWPGVCCWLTSPPGSSVIGGFYHYAGLLLRHGAGRAAWAVVLATLVTGVSVWIAYRDVKISARLMLWVEASSVLVIVTLVALLLVRHGMHWDWDQLRLRGSTGSGLRLGLVMALFSFCGFESATTMGSEARNPLKNDSARRDAERHAGGSLLHGLRLRGSDGLPHRGAGSGNQPRPHARFGGSEWGAGVWIAD